MTDRGRLARAPEVLALLAGRKTQLRMPIEVKKRDWSCPDLPTAYSTRPSPWCQRKTGDRLWVRESLRFTEEGRFHGPLTYAADGAMVPNEMIPEDYLFTMDGIPNWFMPRWASRLTLIVTETKRERLQEISRADVMAEGAPNSLTARLWFPPCWDELHGLGSWDENPEVVALSFAVCPSNIDDVTEGSNL